MIYLFTDFGYQGPYVGELHAVFANLLPGTPVIDLMHDAPLFNPRASAYLLLALSRRFSPGDRCLAVVDPGVGMSARRALLIEADGVVYCGPDNGLLSKIVNAAKKVDCQQILWQPRDLSSSFHGRDCFAPVLAKHACNMEFSSSSIMTKELVGHDWPQQLDEVIYQDHFGNVVLGRQAGTLADTAVLQVSGLTIAYARTFAEVTPGEVFWYRNSMGLIELAMNQGSAGEKLGVSIGSKVSVLVKNV